MAKQQEKADDVSGRPSPFSNAATSKDESLSRRRLMTVGGALALGGLTAAGENVRSALADESLSSSRKDSHALDLSSIPNFCGHEHWGSIASIGTVPEGYRCDVEQGATPKRRTGLLDLILDPYFSSGLRGVGSNPAMLSRRAHADSNPVETMKAVRSLLPQLAMTGTYQCTRRGMLMLHGLDVQRDEPDTITRLDAAIAARYQRMFEWYVEAMKRTNFTGLIRPVHPEYYARQQSAETAAAEARFCRTILRIDPLLDLWRTTSPRRDGLAKMVGVDPTDAQSWRHFIGAIFDLAAQHRTTGIKQLQAYSRSLAFQPVADHDVRWRGELNKEKVRVFQDWVMHECCKQAHERGWPHQVHVGTHNLSQSSPLPLADLATRYPRMKIVQLHCWPFLKEAGWLAKYHANIFIDTCWQPVLSPAFFREAMASWLNYVPVSKIMCSHDSTSVEMAAGSSLFTREILGESLVAHARDQGLTDDDLRKAAAAMLHENAAALYASAQGRQ